MSHDEITAIADAKAARYVAPRRFYHFHGVSASINYQCFGEYGAVARLPHDAERIETRLNAFWHHGFHRRISVAQGRSACPRMP